MTSTPESTTLAVTITPVTPEVGVATPGFFWWEIFQNTGPLHDQLPPDANPQSCGSCTIRSGR